MVFRLKCHGTPHPAFDNAATPLAARRQGTDPKIVLYLAKSFYARNKTITLTGGGTLFCSSPFDGYGSGNTYGIKIQNATLKINGNTTSSAVGLVWIDKQEARLQLKTTVAIAKALIGPTNRIRDNVGFGLKVADIGGGYVEISPKILGSLIEVQ